MTEAERAQVWALRSIIDAMLLNAGELQAPAAAETPREPCPHPEDARNRRGEHVGSEAAALRMVRRVDRDMTPATLRRVVHEIREQRAQLTVEERWWQQQPPSDTRTQAFRRIRFWREVLADAHEKVGRAEAPPLKE